MLQEKLETLGLKKALEDLGYSFEAIFGGLSPELDKLYASYSWQKVPCAQDGIRAGYVIHAVPPEELRGVNPWEEWFFKFDEPHHHVLFLEKRGCCTKEVLIQKDDQEHPEEVKGINWYYYEDSDSLPYLAQKKA
jgi:hypothetical protein